MFPNERTENNQGSADWLADRAGHATASCFADIMARTKPDKAGNTKPLKCREDYLYKLAIERIYGEPMEGPSGRALEWGTEAEPLARGAFEAETGLIVLQTGFIKHPSLPWIGASLDGLIGADGTYESKCPKDSRVHMQTWEHGMPDEHMAQVQGGMWVTGRKQCYFVSYDPRAPEALQLYVQVVPRDDAFIAKMQAEILRFLAEVRAKVDFLQKQQWRMAA